MSTTKQTEIPAKPVPPEIVPLMPEPYTVPKPDIAPERDPKPQTIPLELPPKR